MASELAFRMREDGYLMRINDLERENAKLQEENERLRSVVSDDADNARELLAENKKFREYVKDLVKCVKAPECNMCEWYAHCSCGLRLQERGRELDVELCEVLRLWAKQLRGGMPILASDLRQAANTITCLFDTAQQAQDDSAKLRMLVEDMLDCIEIRMAFGRPITYDIYESFAQRASALGIEVK